MHFFRVGNQATLGQFDQPFLHKLQMNWHTKFVKKVTFSFTNKITTNFTSAHNNNLRPTFTLYALGQCFPTFFASRHPWS